ncbi:Fe-S cluster assembly protein SufD [Paenibacillus larvae]|uniref:Fe-S cluster assembly protein SufD n=1 Tax=Paenibacillus larvae TaxID=1464 RepID=UPI00227E5180|nr:Fe-S cluster assembly protein SufD [Paenibacillus larvae]MCY9511351.1 Fe-S cluster assembly protein SufD [Paenibacillus larvae]MCY9527456.1 Fe-S cluster assembly protein SufD [Paenibacillus larvae]
MTTETILPIDRNSVLEMSRSNQEPEWVTSLRTEALELAGTLEWPKLEKMNITRWNLSSFGTYTTEKSITSIEQLPASVKDLASVDNVLVQRNSGMVLNQLSEELAAKGVIFTDLQTALSKHEELIKPYLFQAVKKEEHKVAALHAASWSGGAFLYVPKNVNLDVPLQALFLSDDAKASFSPHVLIVAEPNSSVTYVENLVSEQAKDSLVQTGIIEVFVKEGAKVNVASIHSLGKHVTDLTYRRAVLENDGQINWIVGDLNHGDSVSDTTSILKGNGSNSDTKIICVGTGDQKLNLTTRAVHFGLDSNSDMITRAVMRDEASAIINGITKIEKGATRANGQQTEKVLMLSPKARGDANPILLIDEDDVKAGHAASVGQVNPEQVFYMMSRGISREEATRLIIYGFLAPVVSEIPITKIEEQLSLLVERKLGQ